MAVASRIAHRWHQRMLRVTSRIFVASCANQATQREEGNLINGVVLRLRHQ